MTKVKWIGTLTALFVTFCAGAYFFRSKSEISYREVLVTRGSVILSILATGGVQAENRLEIKPPVAGRVEDVLVKEGEKVRKGKILAWMSSTERAALLDAARAKGVDELRRWEDLYRPTPILAPIDGTIIQRNVESGQTFTGQDAVFVMADRLTVKAQVDETDLAQIKLKQKAEIVLDAYPEQTLSATVDQIAFDAKTVNNVTTYIVDVLPEKAPDFMRSGMTANVTFIIEEKKGVLWLPSEAVHDAEGSEHTVTVRTSNGKDFTSKNVKVGLSDGKRLEISEGVNEGEIVLIQQKNQNSHKTMGRNPFAPSPPGAKARKDH